THSQTSATARNNEFGIPVTAEQTNPQANQTAVATADVVILGVKPVHILDTASQLAGALRPETVVVSVAAGTTLAALAAVLPKGQPLVRTMPNVALTVGHGVVGLCKGATATDQHVAQVQTVFETSGTVFHVAEQQLNALTAVAGSGPGYVFRFVHALAAAGTELGLEPATAQQLARLTVVGSGALLNDDDADPVALESSIATEGGVTQAALDSLDANNFNQLIVQALKANVA